MSILIDSHVHVYPSHRTGAVLGAFRRAIERAGAQSGALCLVEREGMDAFGAWARGENLPEGTRATHVEENALLLETPGEKTVAVLAGRQIACAERVEILALGTREKFRDGTPAAEAVATALSLGAMPVLAWGVGKWLFSRAKVVAALLRRFPVEDLSIGDTSLRPVFWPEPAAMAEAPSLGRRVLRGSDPLPPASEETRAGEWADLAEEELSPDRPVASSLLNILRETPLVPVGRRAGPVEFLRRMSG